MFSFRKRLGKSSSSHSATRPTLEVLEDRQLLSAAPMDIASTLTHSTEAYGRFVTNAYETYLGRAPDANGLASWVGGMQHGLSDERLEAFFIGSDEYIARHGGSGASWIMGMYQDLLGRTPSQAEVNMWVNALHNGMTPQQVAYGFAASDEREGIRIRDDYLTYLGRAARTGEVQGWIYAFGQGFSNEDIVAGFVGSPESYSRTGGNTDSALWLIAAYRNVLGRTPSEQDCDAWVGHSPRILGTLSQTGEVYVADANNEVRLWDGFQWNDLGQGAIAPDGSFWFLGGPANSSAMPLYRFSNGQMIQQSDYWTELLGVSNDGKVWVAYGSSVYSGDGASWTNQTSPTTLGLVDSTNINGQVVAFARQFIGSRCPANSTGECTDLAIAALQHAGAKTTDDFGVSGPTADYVWGTKVYEDQMGNSGGVPWEWIDQIGPIRAGDIIQYRDVTVVSTTTNPDGSTMTETFTISHHTAIIEAVLGGGRYRILEQNWDNNNPDGRVVRETTINLWDMTQGHYWIYQPVAL
jgi:hypothetical protein